MNVLMIGGTGCLSSAVVEEALQQGMSVTIITRGHRAIPRGVESIVADRQNRETIENALKGRFFDAVIDYLCYTEAQLRDSYTFYSQYTRQYFFISSCAVYNTAICKRCSEDSPKVLPIWDYSIHKWACEQLLEKLAEGAACKYTIIRPCVTYGDTRIPYGISPRYGYHWTLAARVLAGKPIIRWNYGENRCMMTRVEDFAVGVVGLIGNPSAMNEAFNVCGDDAPSFNDVLDALGETLACKVQPVDIDPEFYANEIPWRRGELLGGRCIDALMTNDKIKRVVPSFKQRIFLKEGVEKTIKAYKSQGYQSGIDWDFDAQCDKVILDWLKHNNIERQSYRLEFVDYLNNATFRDKFVYWKTVNSGRMSVRIALKLLSVVRRFLCV